MTDPGPEPTAALSGIEMVLALAGSISRAPGDMPDEKHAHLARIILWRQVSALAEVEPAFREAFRAAVLERVSILAPDDELRERLLADDGDPLHLYWLAIMPEHMLRRMARGLASRQESPIQAFMMKLSGNPDAAEDD